jgi:hypothetical protein
MGDAMANIIIPKPNPFGKTRSEQEANIRKEWGQTVTDEQLDKIKFLEKRLKERTGSGRNFLTPVDADKVK